MKGDFHSGLRVPNTELRVPNIAFEMSDGDAVSDVPEFIKKFTEAIGDYEIRARNSILSAYKNVILTLLRDEKNERYVNKLCDSVVYYVGSSSDVITLKNTTPYTMYFGPELVKPGDSGRFCNLILIPEFNEMIYAIKDRGSYPYIILISKTIELSGSSIKCRSA